MTFYLKTTQNPRFVCLFTPEKWIECGYVCVCLQILFWQSFFFVKVSWKQCCLRDFISLLKTTKHTTKSWRNVRIFVSFEWLNCQERGKKQLYKGNMHAFPHTQTNRRMIKRAGTRIRGLDHICFPKKFRKDSCFSTRNSTKLSEAIFSSFYYQISIAALFRSALYLKMFW